MTMQAFSRILVAASLACAASAHATEIRKCVASDGQVTLTDEACPAGSRVAKVISTPSAEAEPALAPAPAPVAMQPIRPQTADHAGWVRMPVRYVNNARIGASARSASLDGETLRAARAHLRLGDALRSQRMASLQ